MHTLKSCRVCGKPVLRRAKYLCSVECSASERKGRARPPARPRLPCAHCREPFRRKREAQRFCSVTCEQNSRRTAPEPEPVPGAKWIALPRGRFTLVDEADFEALSKFVWSVSGRGTLHSKHYVHRSEGRRWVKMHIQIMSPPPGFMVDHRSGDTLNNRRSNLRLATEVDNVRNSVKRSKTRPFKGVGFDHGRWTASITVDREIKRLGRFGSAEAAARAYDDAARKRFGVFARLNFPREGEQSALVA